jgi:valyl-tRNA synthetase
VALAEMNDHYDKFRLSDALMSVYKLVWDDFCSWYLELVKPAYEQPIDPRTLNETIAFLEELLKLLHPFTPFIAEEIWDSLGERTEKDRVIIAQWPQVEAVDAELIEAFDRATTTIMEVRRVRNEKQLPPKAPLQLFVKGNADAGMNPVISKLAFLSGYRTVVNEDPYQCRLVRHQRRGILHSARRPARPQGGEREAAEGAGLREGFPCFGRKKTEQRAFCERCARAGASAGIQQEGRCPEQDKGA